MNVIQEEPADPADPSSLRYSPIWDVTPGTWAAAVITAGRRTRLTSIQPTATQTAPSITQQAQIGALVSAPFAGGPYNPSVGLNAAGLVSLCPVVAVLPVSP